MGFLQLIGAPLNLSRAVVSVWFKVPTGVSPPRGGGVFGLPLLPLITFGQSVEVPQGGIMRGMTGYGSYPPCTNRLYRTGISNGTIAVGASVIGVLFEPTESWAPLGRFFTMLQTNITPSASAFFYGGTPVCTTAGWEQNTDQTGLFLYPDSYTGESFGNNAAPGFNPHPLVTKGKWHHLILSWDLTNGCGSQGFPFPYTSPTWHIITSVSKMWMSYDATNYYGASLPSIWPNNIDNVTDWGNNDIVSAWIAGVSGTLGIDVSPFTYGTASLSGGGPITSRVDVPSSTDVIYDAENSGSYQGAVWIGNQDYTSPEPNLDTIFAELQVYQGVSLDTTTAGNRQLFVNNGKPVDVSVPTAFFGRPPDIYLGSSNPRDAQINWINGRNLGTAGDFTVFGTILKASPDPLLGS